MQNTQNVIGIAGTAKNTGKTTTLNCLLKEAVERNTPVAITSIGFDGEELDNVTLLPKPRVIVYPHSIVTTSEQCLDISTAKFEVLQRTGIFTSLGEILIIRIIEIGLMVIAGPSKKKDLQIVLEKIERYNIDYIFVDGSLNRISPMSVVHSIIFTTGASRTTDISVLSSEMKAIEYLFHLPISHHNPDSKSFTLPLLLDVEDVDGLKELLTKKHTALFISKMISLTALERLTALCANGSIQLQTLQFPDPFALLITENIVQSYQHILELKRSYISVTYRNAPKFSCITANPFFPHYVGSKYYSEYIDRKELVKQLRSSCSTPIFDTQETDPSLLFDACFS